MLIDLLKTVCGMAILLVGGDLMVRGASSLARSLGVSALAVGLTVVAFGTSAPELAVSLGAALSGSTNLAFGNIFGSNLANIGLIIGLSALVRPLPIDSVITRRELPMMLLAVVAATVMAIDIPLGDTIAQFSRSDGLILLLFFVVFLYYTIGDLILQRSKQSKNGSATKPTADKPAQSGNAPDTGSPPDKSMRRSLFNLALGLGALLLGAELTVDGGVAIARAAGVPEVVVGLTIISVGTSLPELVTTLSAVRRGELAIAVGVVVGSNIFNVLLVCGLTSMITPIEIPARGLVDLALTAVLSLALLMTARTHSRLILRWEGAGLLIAYVTYMIWRSIQTS
ncbi:MAG: calcium/sodium antiporter [Deltaproteobacteria bacterium]|nr:calcium/sodium antiporter [Deltaproteobacteria bacterium]